jgi:hypothetical protein
MCAALKRSGWSLLPILFGIHVTCAEPPRGVREALAEFETGATNRSACDADRLIGSRKEISRYQILPSVWRQYSASRNYHDPELAWTVAARILADRERWFRAGAGRAWDYVDIYVMWNAPGQYERVHWDRARLTPAVIERAQRFANLLEVRASAHAPR